MVTGEVVQAVREAFSRTLGSKRGEGPSEIWRKDISEEGPVTRCTKSGLGMKEEALSKSRARDKKGLVPPQSLASPWNSSEVP